eukprot:gene1742-2467_t
MMVAASSHGCCRRRQPRQSVTCPPRRSILPAHRTNCAISWSPSASPATGFCACPERARPRQPSLFPRHPGGPMPILYIANKNYSSWSLRPWVLLKQLGIPFTERLVPFGGDVPYTAFSPTGKVPCLVDGEVTVWESLAIVEYLAERHPDVWPTDPTARAWARSACAEMHAGFSTLRNLCSMNCGLRVRLQTAVHAAQVAQ